MVSGGDGERPGASRGSAGSGDSADRLAEGARASAEALLDWLGPRLDAAEARAGGRDGGSDAGPPGTSRAAQSAGPCTWCPVCALVAALRGEQPELTARLAEQAAGFVVLLRLLVEGHGTRHATDRHGGAPDPDAPGPDTPDPDTSDQDTPDPEPPDPDASDQEAPGDRSPGRPTGRRSPRPSPRLRSVPPAGPPAPPAPPPRTGTRRRPAVQRIPVRRVASPNDQC